MTPISILSGLEAALIEAVVAFLSVLLSQTVSVFLTPCWLAVDFTKKFVFSMHVHMQVRKLSTLDKACNVIRNCKVTTSKCFLFFYFFILFKIVTYSFI